VTDLVAADGIGVHRRIRRPGPDPTSSTTSHAHAHAAGLGDRAPDETINHIVRLHETYLGHATVSTAWKVHQLRLSGRDVSKARRRSRGVAPVSLQGLAALSESVASAVVATVLDLAGEVRSDRAVHAVALAFDWGTADESMWLPLAVPLPADPPPVLGDTRTYWDPFCGPALSSAGVSGVDGVTHRLIADPRFVCEAANLSAMFDELLEASAFPESNELTFPDEYAVAVARKVNDPPAVNWGFDIGEPFVVVPFTTWAEFPALLQRSLSVDKLAALKAAGSI
jgi:hypothetical protein